MSREALRDFIAHHDDRWLFVAVYIGLAVVLSILLSLFWLVAVAGLHFALEYMRQAQYRAGRADIVTHALWEIKLDIALVLLALAMSLYMEVILGVLGLQSAARAAAATRVARFAAWERNLRAVILLADDVVIGATRLLRRTQAKTAAVQQQVGGSVTTTASFEAARSTQTASTRGSGGTGHDTGRGAGGTAHDTGHGAGGTARREGRRAKAGPVAAHVSPAMPRSWRDRWSIGDRITLGLLIACLLLIVLAPMLTDHSWGGATIALLEQLHPFPPR